MAAFLRNPPNLRHRRHGGEGETDRVKIEIQKIQKLIIRIYQEITSQSMRNQVTFQIHAAQMCKRQRNYYEEEST